MMYVQREEVAMAATSVSRLNFRISAESERQLRSAAEASHETLTDFVLGAAQDRADEVLRTRTVVPSDYFDQLLAALDEPPVSVPALAKAARRKRQFVQR
jgi:uncharacterized protein (DUF1778 family)